MEQPKGEFAGYPRSVTEVRAERADRAGLGQPRDALIELLRQIDEGEINCTGVVVAYEVIEADGRPFSTYTASGPAVDKRSDAIGILEIAKLSMMLEGV